MLAYQIRSGGLLSRILIPWTMVIMKTTGVVKNMALPLLFSHTHIEPSLYLYCRHRSASRLWVLER
jgi:hypothetical protein